MSGGGGAAGPSSSLNSSAASPVARIEQLKAIEQDVVGILESAGLCLQELGKDKPGSQKAIEAHNQQVMSNIRDVDAKLSEQIKYLTQVSTGQAHEGSSYPSQKVLQTAWHRLEHAKTRIHGLEQNIPQHHHKQQPVLNLQQKSQGQ